MSGWPPIPTPQSAFCRDCGKVATFGDYCARHWLVHGGYKKPEENGDQVRR
jgi:hypothetical protein